MIRFAVLTLALTLALATNSPGHAQEAQRILAEAADALQSVDSVRYVAEGHATGDQADRIPAMKGTVLLAKLSGSPYPRMALQVEVEQLRAGRHVSRRRRLRRPRRPVRRP
jgi:hypothetical protein